MLDPTLRALFVAVIIAILKVLAERFGVPVSDDVLYAIAIAIIGWIFGNPAGKATAQTIVEVRRARIRPE